MYSTSNKNCKTLCRSELSDRCTILLHNNIAIVVSNATESKILIKTDLCYNFDVKTEF